MKIEPLVLIVFGERWSKDMEVNILLGQIMFYATSHVSRPLFQAFLLKIEYRNWQCHSGDLIFNISALAGMLL